MLFFYRLLLAMVLIAPGLFAQDTTCIRSAIPVSAMRFSPLHLMNFYPTIQIGYEHRISGRFTAYVEGGYVLDYNKSENQNSRSEYQNKRGFKVKVEPRFYHYQSRSGKVAFYAALEVYKNHVNFDRSETVIECYDGDCVHMYERLRTYEVKYREYGFIPKWGVMIYLDDFFFDFNTGLGIRNIDYRKPTFPGPGVEDDVWGEFEFLPIEEKRTVPGLALGIRIGYRIK